MTEFGSHQVSSSIGSKPSIFEVLAEESLTTGLRDAFRHFTKVLAENFPHKFGAALHYFEEMYTVFDFIFHLIHIRIHSASFSEHFYGLCRVPDARSKSVSGKKVLILVSILTVFPYLRFQLEKIFKLIREKEHNGSLNMYKDVVKKWALFYKSLYPWLHFSWETSVLCYYIAYSLNKSDYHSPLLHITSTKLVNSSNDEFVLNTWEEDTFMQSNKIKQILWKTAKAGVGGITLSISAGAFLLQFLQWWYSNEGGTTAMYPMPIPPPPPKWPVDVPSDLCPLCLKIRRNDTALSCSGFVFCYPCIYRYVQEQKRCPVTGYPATLSELIKIYHQDVPNK